MSILAVSDKTIAVGNGNLIDCYDYNKHYILHFESESNESVADVIISTNNRYLAFMSTNKKLIVYELLDFKCIKNISLPRSASKIRFSINNTQIFVADKTGDVLCYDILKEDNGINILGHLSLLLNVLQTNDGKYIITCDRDEKIRVSHYPNTYNIQTFCLGHKEFVNHIELLPHNDKYLISASGDGSIKCWDYLSGKLSYSFDTNVAIVDELKEDFRKVMDSEGVEANNLPIVNIAVTSFGVECSLIAVTVHSYKKILLYSLTTKNKFIHKLEKEISFEFFPVAFKLNGPYLIVYDDVNLMLLKYNILSKDDKTDIILKDNIRVFEDHTVKTQSDVDIDLIKIMFKRKFDNVQEYRERKKQRMAKSNENVTNV